MLESVDMSSKMRIAGSLPDTEQKGRRVKQHTATVCFSVFDTRSGYMDGSKLGIRAGRADGVDDAGEGTWS